MRISFDFDGCIDKNVILQSIAKTLLKDNFEIFILTSRNSTLENLDLWKVVEDIGIKKDNVLFSYHTSKLQMFIDKKLDMHFDDDHLDVDDININCGRGSAVLVGMRSDFLKAFYSKTLDEFDC